GAPRPHVCGSGGDGTRRSGRWRNYAARIAQEARRRERGFVLTTMLTSRPRPRWFRNRINHSVEKPSRAAVREGRDLRLTRTKDARLFDLCQGWSAERAD